MHQVPDGAGSWNELPLATQNALDGTVNVLWLAGADIEAPASDSASLRTRR